MVLHRVVPALVLVAALTGCGGGDGPEAPPPAAGSPPGSPPSSPSAPTDGPARIVIENFVFAPSSLRVRVGQEITVVNRDQAAHTVTATDKKFDTEELGKDDVATIRVSAPGEYPFICDLHQYMKGTLTAS